MPITTATVDSNNMTLVDIKANVTPVVLDHIRRLGGEIINSHPRFKAVRARIPIEKVEEIAALPDIRNIRPADRMITRKTNTSEGDVAHRADLVHSQFNLDGTGKSVCVISDGVDSLAAVQATGDLPNVTVLSGQAGSGNEGTAMLEIVYDLAPGATLFFATGDNGQAQFAQNILDLAAAGCDVIVDDAFYTTESVFQDSEIADAIDTVTAQGVLYFSSAGNAGNLYHGSSGVWEGDYVDSGSDLIFDPVANVINPSPPTPNTGNFGDMHSFGGGGSQPFLNKITADPPDFITLQWSDPLGASTNDYDLFLVNSDFTEVIDFSNAAQEGAEDPIEIINGGNLTGSHLIVIKFLGSDRMLHLNTHGGRLAIGTNGQIFGHTGARGAIAVAAVNVAAVNLATAGGSGGETIWVEDSVPAGATQSGTWNFVNANPAPFSGALAHQSVLQAGRHEHSFYNATDTLTVNTGDTLITYVYLDPDNPPSEVMLQWNDGTSWQHRAFWGANFIGLGISGTNSRRFMGPLPPAGQWVRLEVPASSVGLEGAVLSGMAFTLYNGRVTWDHAGKSGAAVESSSSDGPRRVHFKADGTPWITPPPPEDPDLPPADPDLTSTGGDVRQKPDIAAADGVATAAPGFNPFFGTSAAAAHAAATAALMLSSPSNPSPDTVRQIMFATAHDIETTGIDDVSGHGIVDAFAALDLPDLIAEWVKLKPGCPGAPAECQIKGKLAIANQGLGSVPAAPAAIARIYYSADDTLDPSGDILIKEFPVPVLAAGVIQGNTVKLPMPGVTTIPSGASVYVRLDFNNDLLESNELNNQEDNAPF